VVWRKVIKKIKEPRYDDIRPAYYVEDMTDEKKPRHWYIALTSGRRSELQRITAQFNSI
jgi:hypothetical protein